MVTFAGVDHLSFSVTDLEVSQRFYTAVLELVLVIDAGTVRILMHPPSGFVLALVQHPEARGGPFSELATGMDHVGFRVGTRADLEAWERRFDELGVRYTPIRDMEFGHSLNFRDPDDLALELTAPTELMVTAREALAAGVTDPETIAAFVAEHLPDL